MQTRRDVFQAIADPTRREIINLVAFHSMNLNAIAEKFDMSRPAISQHIKLLTECGLIVIKQQGRERFCEARLQQFNQVSDWIEKYRKLWAGRFEALDDLLEEMKAQPVKKLSTKATKRTGKKIVARKATKKKPKKSRTKNK